MAVLVSLIAAAIMVAQPTEPRCLAVEVLRSVPTTTVRASQIIHAVRLRTHRKGLRVRQNCPGTADWIVQAGSAGDSITITMVTQQGAMIHESELPVGERQPTEVAHTVSLKVIEALAPLAPELLTAAPAAPPDVLLELPPPPVEVKDEPTWAIGIGGSMLVSWPDGRFSPGVTLHLEADRHGLLMVGEMSWWSPIQGDGSDYQLSVDQSALRIGVGWRFDLGGGVSLGLTGGVLARLALVRASGDHVEIDQRWLLDPGVDAQADASVMAGPVEIGLALSFGTMLRNPQLMVDGVGVVDLGSMLAVAALRVGYPW